MYVVCIPIFLHKIYCTIYILVVKYGKKKGVVMLGGKYTEAQKEATKKYMKRRKTIHVVVSEKRHREIKDHAASMKESINAFVIRAINETMEKDKGE